MKKTDRNETGANGSASTIREARKKIDEIDDRLLELINRRIRLAQDIGKAKADTGSMIQDNVRESEILRRLDVQNKGPLNESMLRQIFLQIIESSRRLQSSTRVSYLGPEATFSHIAAMQYFGHSASLIPQQNIRDVFTEVEKGTCRHGVVPVENSLGGSVSDTLDLFFESGLKICAEKYLPISNDLLSNCAAIEDVRVVYSHPQPFAQCGKWLRRYLPNVELKDCSSTARAARKASEIPGAAAIASSAAAHIYKLDVLASKIQDVHTNTTRFLVIGQEEVPMTGKDKTSILFVTSHKPGALYKTLKPLSDSGINLVKLESRPTRRENWNYFFFVEMEGHIDDANVNAAVTETKSLCQYLKHLGSYPKAKNTNGDIGHI